MHFFFFLLNNTFILKVYMVGFIACYIVIEKKTCQYGILPQKINKKMWFQVRIKKAEYIIYTWQKKWNSWSQSVSQSSK